MAVLKKALMVTSFTAGYVLGARAGRERYEQIRTLFLRVKTNPEVRAKVHDAVDFAHDQSAAWTAKAVHAVRRESADDPSPEPPTADPTNGFAVRF